MTDFLLRRRFCGGPSSWTTVAKGADASALYREHAPALAALPERARYAALEVEVVPVAGGAPVLSSTFYPDEPMTATAEQTLDDRSVDPVLSGVLPADVLEELFQRNSKAKPAPEPVVEASDAEGDPLTNGQSPHRGAITEDLRRIAERHNAGRPATVYGHLVSDIVDWFRQRLAYWNPMLAGAEIRVHTGSGAFSGTPTIDVRFWGPNGQQYGWRVHLSPYVFAPGPRHLQRSVEAAADQCADGIWQALTGSAAGGARRSPGTAAPPSQGPFGRP